MTTVLRAGGATLLLLTAGCAETPLLTAASASSPGADWVRQLRSSPTYHGTFVVAAPHLTLEGTIASDPEHRRLRVTTADHFFDEKEDYRRTVELTIDGTRARLVGRASEGSHTSFAVLPPLDVPEAPFGPVQVALANFTFGGDLRQTMLDCLTGTLTQVAPGVWRVRRPADAALAELVSRRAHELVNVDGSVGSPRNRCDGLEFLAGPGGALSGYREGAGEDAFTTTVRLFPGLKGVDFTVDDHSLEGATDLTAEFGQWRAMVEALIKDPARLANVRPLNERRPRLKAKLPER